MDMHTGPTDEAGKERGWVLHAATGKFHEDDHDDTGLPGAARRKF